MTTTLEDLPSEVINDIFHRVNDDAKFLTQCLLISKRIASHLHLVSSVSFNFHRTQNRIETDNYNLVALCYKLICPSQQADNIVSFCEVLSFGKVARYYNCKAREALHPFSKVDTAIVFGEYLWFDTLRCLMEYSEGVNFIKSCAFLETDHNPKGITTDGFYKEDDREREIINYWVARLFRTAFNYVPMVAQMVHDHDNLRDILVTGPSGNGWIHAAEDEIVKMRQAGGTAEKMIKMMMEMEMHMKVKVWYVSCPNESTVYRFVVVSSPDNINQDMKAVTRRFWDDTNYWIGPRDDKIQEGWIDRKMREVVETMPCNLEYLWVVNIERVNNWQGKKTI